MLVEGAINMADTLDLTLLVGKWEESARDIRLMRLQLDALASRLWGRAPPPPNTASRSPNIDGRFPTIDTRIGSVEQSVHALTNEVAHGFGRVKQQLSRHEKRFDGLDAALSKL